MSYVSLYRGEIHTIYEYIIFIITSRTCNRAGAYRYGRVPHYYKRKYKSANIISLKVFFFFKSILHHDDDGQLADNVWLVSAVRVHI